MQPLGHQDQVAEVRAHEEVVEQYHQIEINKILIHDFDDSKVFLMTPLRDLYSGLIRHYCRPSHFVALPYCPGDVGN